MNKLAKSILFITGLALAITVSILVMINGWGLEPKSYAWIIGASFFGHIIAQSIIEVAKGIK